MDVGDIMEKYIKKLAEKYKLLFGDKVKIKEVNIGFTNTIYNVNDQFIIKVCTDNENEDFFKREIAFYNNNQNNDLIPILYDADTSREDIPYYYEILEKNKGVSLYSIWHTLDENTRYDITRQIVDAMKLFHSNKGFEYDWLNYNKDKFNDLYNEAKKLNLFSNNEKKLINYAYNKFDKYLDNNGDFVFIHNDLHFDNIFYDSTSKKIKIIDFERSMYAPKDFELDIINRMINKPWKFASEETEKLINSSDYSNIRLYLEELYPDLFKHPNLDQRLAIYDMIYYMEQFIENTDSTELKNDIINATEFVALKDELTFDRVNTPEDLMKYMDLNIQYGWIDKDNKKHINNLHGFRETYKTISVSDTIKYGLGTCIEQANFIKAFFDAKGKENKMYCFRTYETEDNFDKDERMHCFILYKSNNNWYHFEHANPNCRGIHKYNSLDDAIETVTNNLEDAKNRVLTEVNHIPDGLSFKEVNLYVNNLDNEKKKEI